MCINCRYGDAAWLITRAIVILVLAILSWSCAQAQGTVTFNNGASINGGAGARVLLAPDGTPGGFMTLDGYAPTGEVWKAQLYSAPGNVTEPCSLAPAGVPVPFRTGTQGGNVEARSTQINPFTGLRIDDQVVVTPVAGGPATVQLRAWDAAFDTYEEACYRGLGASSPLLFLASTGIGGAGGTPGALLNGLQGFGFSPGSPPYCVCVPEPSTIGLAMLAIGALAFQRIRRV